MTPCSVLATCHGSIPVTLAQARLLLQIQRLLDPSRTLSASCACANILRGFADTQRSRMIRSLLHRDLDGHFGKSELRIHLALAAGDEMEALAVRRADF